VRWAGKKAGQPLEAFFCLDFLFLFQLRKKKKEDFWMISYFKL
jgi:hypothetical protein